MTKLEKNSFILFLAKNDFSVCQLQYIKKWYFSELSYYLIILLLFVFWFLIISCSLLWPRKKLQKSYKLFLKNVWVIFLKIALRRSTSCTKRHHFLCRLCIILFWLLWKGRRWKNQSQSFLVFFKITKTKSDKKVKNLNHGC